MKHAGEELAIEENTLAMLGGLKLAKAEGLTNLLVGGDSTLVIFGWIRNKEVPGSYMVAFSNLWYCFKVGVLLLLDSLFNQSSDRFISKEGTKTFDLLCEGFSTLFGIDLIIITFFLLLVKAL